jgi:hypothetical protein
LPVDYPKLSAAIAEITTHFAGHCRDSGHPTSEYVRSVRPKFYIGTCLEADLTEKYGRKVVQRAFAKLSSLWDMRGNA